jgi:hypothetical protein
MKALLAWMQILGRMDDQLKIDVKFFWLQKGQWPKKNKNVN